MLQVPYLAKWFIIFHQLRFHWNSRGCPGFLFLNYLKSWMGVGWLGPFLLTWNGPFGWKKTRKTNEWQWKPDENGNPEWRCISYLKKHRWFSSNSFRGGGEANLSTFDSATVKGSKQHPPFWTGPSTYTVAQGQVVWPTKLAVFLPWFHEHLSMAKKTMYDGMMGSWRDC